MAGYMLLSITVMLKQKKLSTGILVVFTMFYLLLLVKSSAQANPDMQFQDCGQGYFGVAVIPAGKYEIYVDPGDMKDRTLKLIYQDFRTGTCQTLAKSENNNVLRKIGTISAPESGLSGSLILASSSNIGFGNPSGQKVIFKPIGQVCDYLKGCTVDFQGQIMQLKPKKLSLNSDNLTIALLQPIGTDSISEVIYSVDKKPAYKSKTLEDFNKNYVPPGEHELERTAILKSGQALTDTYHIKKDYSPQNILAAWAYRYEGFIKRLGFIIGFWVIFMAILILVKVIVRKKKWHRTHVHKQTEKVASKESVLAADNRRDWLLPTRRGLLAFGGLIAVFFIITSWFITFFTVDGLSMYSTLQDRQQLALSKLPISWATLNRTDYIPKRGEIIVFNHADNNLFDPSATSEKQYVVKRVIALPGERVVLRDGKLNVINEEFPIGFDPDKNVEWSEEIRPTLNQVFDITLGSGELFVAGDNRDNSIDSRFYGPIKASDIVGVVIK